MSDNKQQQGAILLITLLIIAGVTSVGLGVSLVIFNNLRSSSLIGNSISATYASEAGMERALEKVNEGRTDGLSLDTVMTTIQAMVGTQTNGSGWRTNQSTSQTDAIVLDVAQGLSAQVDIFDPGNEKAGFNNIEKMSINAEPTSGWAEVSWVAWDGLNFISNSRTVLVNPSDLVNGRIIDIYGVGDVNDPIFISLTDGHQLRAFRVTVKARFGDLNDITIQAINNANPPAVVNIPNRVTIKSRGTSGGVAVALNASIPWRLPTSALFDFVIFSDESIEK